MGRRATGSRPWNIFNGRGVAFISTTVGGQRIRESLGVPFPLSGSGKHARIAEAAAEARYRQLIEGRVLAGPQGSRILTAHTLDELLGMWLADVLSLYPSSWKMFQIHSRHLVAFADTPVNPSDRRTPLQRLTDDGAPEAYGVWRLHSVLRTTARKELSTLSGFLAWAKSKRYLASLPERTKLPSGMKGKRIGSQRAKSVFVTHAQALAIIELLPEWAARGSRPSDEKSKVKGAYRVRDTMRFAYETGLRPATLARLSVPTHWSPGRATLTITDDADKSRYGREVPLSKVAAAILERVAPDAGLIFGKHDYRHHYKSAAAKVLPPELADDFAPYDLRHGRARLLLAASGDILGTGFLLGHRQATTTNHYLRGSLAAGQAAVNAAEGFGSNSAANEEGPTLPPAQTQKPQ